jgi:hypothetical protein
MEVEGIVPNSTIVFNFADLSPITAAPTSSFVHPAIMRSINIGMGSCRCNIYSIVPFTPTPAVSRGIGKRTA